MRKVVGELLVIAGEISQADALKRATELHGNILLSLTRLQSNSKSWAKLHDGFPKFHALHNNPDTVFTLSALGKAFRAEGDSAASDSCADLIAYLILADKLKVF
jgi:hypothetical protein